MSTTLIQGLEADFEGDEFGTSSPSLAGALDRMLADEEDLTEVLNRLAENGHGVWIVGGWVRDVLSGKGEGGSSGNDVDLATTATPTEMIDIFPDGIAIGVDFGTFGIRVEGGSEAGMWEATTLRSDGLYVDHRHPEKVSWSTSLRQDLNRRDFTFNAMAVDPARRLVYDPHGGREDLAAGVLRAVGVAELRITEDALRILRAYRFLAHAGPAAILDDRLHESMIKQRELLGQVSAERWWQELKRMFSGLGAVRSLLLMKEDNVLDVLMPGDTAPIIDFSADDFESVVQELRPNVRCQVVLSSILRGLSVDEMHGLLRHWMTPRRTREMAIQHFQWSERTPDSNDVEQLRRFRHAVGEHIDVVISLMLLWTQAGEVDAIRTALSELAPLRSQPDPVIDGLRLMEVTGLDKGPAVGALKRSLHRLQVERDLTGPDAILSLIDEVGDQDLGGPVWP
ncbi:MAG TPA: CCA tRNA nucleotidyltransferase [Candidatus Poseidoniales archaeon]|nr:CCA tRNA nucleotidyltransferase [Candidatus Poseidoniales archaeon]